MNNKELSIGLVLAGGGARGAYEAGVVTYVLDKLGGEPGVNPHFNIFAGTSIGALNCSKLAADADDQRRAARGLNRYWRSITIDRILSFGLGDLKRVSSLFLNYGNPIDAYTKQKYSGIKAPHRPIQGVFNTGPLFNEMGKLIHWDKVRKNLDNGSLKGLAVCATEVCTGKSLFFYQTSEDCRFITSNDPAKEARLVELRVDHAMASAAIPFIFPSVQIDGACYVDGALKQNTPIFPALRMGADKLMVVSLAQEPELAYARSRAGCRAKQNPGAIFLLARIVNAFMTEALDYELGRVEMFNSLIKTGQEIYGEEFLDNINNLTSNYRKSQYRLIDTCLIRPSEDLNDLAVEAFNRSPDEAKLPGITGKAFGKIIGSSDFLESEFISFLLFTPTYIKTLIDLGYEDARAAHDRILEFFEPQG